MVPSVFILLIIFVYIDLFEYDCYISLGLHFRRINRPNVNVEVEDLGVCSLIELSQF
jgi:hypothetical protein